MFWFKKKSKTIDRIEQKEKLVQVEVAQHKEDRANAIDKTQKITDNFNKVLKENGITIQIFQQVGGKH